MIKLIIVDDEKTTRESLKECIDWKSLRVDKVEIAKNGLAALENAQQIIPDIVITDARMPKMDGIKFATRVRELYPECKIIFISGYSDKEYLKSAIHLKAVSYIENPINIEDVEAAVLESVSIYYDDAKRKADTEKLKGSLIESIPFIRQEVALELVKDEDVIHTLVQKYDEPFLKLSQNGYFTTACIVLNWASTAENNYKTIENVSNTAWYQKVSQNGNKLYSLSNSDLEGSEKNVFISAVKGVIYNQDINIMGVVRIDIPSANFKETLDRSLFTKSTAAFLVNDSYNIVCSSGSTDIEKDPSFAGILKNFNNYNEVAEWRSERLNKDNYLVAV